MQRGVSREEPQPGQDRLQFFLGRKTLRRQRLGGPPSWPAFFAQLQLWGGKNRNDDGTWHRKQALRELDKLTPPESVQIPPYYPRDPLILKDWAEYLDCLRYCDKLVGQILQRLEREGILDQTFVVLLGDNGISHARGKQFLYDEGIRGTMGPTARSTMRTW